MTSYLTARRALAATLLLSLGACSRHRSAGASAPAARESARTRDDVSDGNIVAILLAANNTDISYARLAPSRAQSQAVKDFAQQMLNDHTAVNGLVTDLINALTLTPEDNKTSLDFRDESAGKRDILRELDGKAFDKTYLENEVTYHVNFLSEIDSRLLPLSHSPRLRQLISNIRPAVAAHLAHARQVQAGMTGGQ